MPQTHIDYIQMSSNDIIFEYDYDTAKFENSFITNYKTMKRLSDSLSIHSGHNNSDKYLILATGEHAQTIANALLTPTRISEHKLTISRMDIAITQSIVERDFMTVRQFYEKAQSGLITRSAKFNQVKAIISPKFNHETVYLGDQSKRGKNGIFRCYDKGLQLDLELFKKDKSHTIHSGVLTRYELEMKRKTAHANAVAYANGVQLNHIIGKFVQIPNITNQLDTYPRHKPTAKTSGELEHDRLQWIERIIPTVGRDIGRLIASGSINAMRLYRMFYDNVKLGYEERMDEMIRHELTMQEIERYEQYLRDVDTKQPPLI